VRVYIHTIYNTNPCFCLHILFRFVTYILTTNVQISEILQSHNLLKNVTTLHQRSPAKPYASVYDTIGGVHGAPWSAETDNTH